MYSKSVAHLANSEQITFCYSKTESTVDPKPYSFLTFIFIQLFIHLCWFYYHLTFPLFPAFASTLSAFVQTLTTLVQSFYLSLLIFFFCVLHSYLFYFFLPLSLHVHLCVHFWPLLIYIFSVQHLSFNFYFILTFALSSPQQCPSLPISDTYLCLKSVSIFLFNQIGLKLKTN